jgi:hypothetical protein
MYDWIARLRRQRGHQSVTFAEIADHLFDYSERFRGDHEVVERIAHFLIAVEQVPHDHDADTRRGVPQERVVSLEVGAIPATLAEQAEPA